MNIFDNPHYDKHEKVVFGYDEASGLKAIIAVHNTALGPSLGGCRMHPYATEEAALADVLRLSKGMTYKSAMAELPLGGGKSVIIGDPAKDKTPALMEAMGEFVETVSGHYIVAKDMGITVDDLAIMARRSKHVSGVSGTLDEAGQQRDGDPSRSTAYGMFCGVMASVKHRYDRTDLEGLRVAVQGLGSVGYRLASMLQEQGAQLLVTDINAANVQRAVDELGAKAVSADEILTLEVDILSPCAMGAVINDQTVNSIRADIVAGAANNQLATPAHGETLFRRGILYAPDYVINAGGIIDAWYMETRPDDAKALKAHVENIANTLEAIFQESDRAQLPTNVIADRMAESRLQVEQRMAS
ncbi:Glu/Leu/Phe/Val family dehydrogenase [Gilvimarinus sp. F26214L]|uniref:Glu/Leu/Phe/Val family dehydrogenase n=1 Tax=Gilvimarinus sp. DZF01 TaxID=3461371 RepID=UPI004045458F